jgi:WD40 repeat protein
MQDDTLTAHAPCSPLEAGSRRERTGRTRFVFRRRRSIVLLLALALLAPWLPRHWRVPASQPSHRAYYTGQSAIGSLAFSPDGQTLATTDGSGHVTIWHAGKVDGWRARRALDVNGYSNVISFTHEDNYIAIGIEGSDVALWDPERGTLKRHLGIPVRQMATLRISPDGRTLAASSTSSHEILIWDLDAGRERMTLRGHTTPVCFMAFAPDGRSLASAIGVFPGQPIRIWDLTTGRPERSIGGSGGAVLSIAYSPDGRWLAACTAHEPARIWDVRTGAQVLTLAGHSQPSQSLAFSPDGRLLATVSADGTGDLWSMPTGRELRRLDGQADALFQVAFSPDGKTLAATGNDCIIRFWNVDELLEDGPDR